MDTLRFLDILGFAVGLAYLYLEYRANIWLWLVSIIMPAIDMMLYFKAGLYADFGMAIYYCLASIYGWLAWSLPLSPSKREGTTTSSYPLTLEGTGGRSEARERRISHFPKRLLLPTLGMGVALWIAIYWFLSRHTDSTVPLTDAFTTALSIVALWALARKFAEQWLMWLVVDAICCALYIYKGIPFKAIIYGIYTVFAVFGYRKWLRMMANPAEATA